VTGEMVMNISTISLLVITFASVIVIALILKGDVRATVTLWKAAFSIETTQKK